MPIKFNRAKLRVKDDSGCYTSVFDILSSDYLGDYIIYNVQPWIDGKIGDDQLNQNSDHPAYHNNAKFYRDQAASYSNNLSNFTTAAQTSLVNSLASAYASNKGYKVGQIALNQGNLYKCISQIDSNGEGFDPTHWMQIDFGNENINVKNSLKNCLRGLGIEIATNWSFKLNPDSNNGTYGFYGNVIGASLGDKDSTTSIINPWSIADNTSKYVNNSLKLITTYLQCQQGDLIYTNARGGTVAGSYFPACGFVSEHGIILNRHFNGNMPNNNDYIEAKPNDSYTGNETIKYVYINNNINIVPQEQVYLCVIKQNSIIYSLINLLQEA